MKKYFNYHIHSYYSNIATPDVVASKRDYAKKAKELGHEWLSSCEHGQATGFTDCYSISEEFGLKFIYVAEFYFVRDRFEKDVSNYHMILVAKTNNAIRELNYITSEANSSGYYYKPRIDLDLLKQLPKNEVICCTACVGGFLRDYPNTKDILSELISIFGKDNLFLEVQSHNVDKQVEYNKLLKTISKEYGLKLIAGVDSHMIETVDSQLRDYLLHSKGIIYEDEREWVCDYPDYETLKQRFLLQGIWTENEVETFIDNTLELTESEVFKIEKKMRIPDIFEGKSREFKLSYFKKLIWDAWEKEKPKKKKELIPKYEEAIREEYNIVESSNTENYFIMDNALLKEGVENGGILTRTGRGSGTSFYINNLLGFTTLDRVDMKIPLIPERFMSIDRVQSGSLPDLDINLWNREAFIQAQKKIFGEHSNYFMIAYGTLGVKSAFKMLCRAKNIPVETADEISKLISTYEKDKKHNESVELKDYISNEYIHLIEESDIYTGIVDSCSQHPCGMLLLNGDIRREFGLIKAPNGALVANITGAEADKFGYVKNDLLIVQVVGMNDALYKRIGVKIPSSNEIIEISRTDSEIWKLYENGFTMCLNQVEGNGTTLKVMKYKPKTFEELCAFIASVRPGFQSFYNIFEKREKFEFGVKKIDDFLRGDFLDGSFLLYQEQQLMLLVLIGIDGGEAYTVLKAISKKKKHVIESVEKEFKEKLLKYIEEDPMDINGKKEVINRLWQVFIDSSKYSFNASHSACMATDSLYTAYVKAHHPLEFYEVVLEIFSNDKDTKKVALLKNEAYRYKGITVAPMKFGQDNTRFTSNKDKNEIYQSLMSVKAINSNTSLILKELKDNKYDNFYDLYIDMKSRGLSKTHISNLCKIGYFSDIATRRNALWLAEHYDVTQKKGQPKILDINKKTLKKDDIPFVYNEIKPNMLINEFYEELKKVSSKETAKQMSFEEGVLSKFLYSFINIQDDNKLEEYAWELGLMGTTIEDIDESFLMGMVVKYNPSTNRVLMKHCKTGEETWYKMNCNVHVKENNYIFIKSITEKSYRGRTYITVEDMENLTEKFLK